MATRLKDGRYRATWVNPETGKREPFYSRVSAEDAERQKSERIQALTHWKPTERRGDDLESLAMRYWWPMVELRVPNTKRRYLISWNQVAPLFGLRRARSITRDEIQSWANSRLQAGASPATVRHTVSVLSSIYHAASDELGGYNPTRSVRLPARKKRKRVMSVTDLRNLLSQVEGTSLAGPVFLSAVLGLRRGELCGLKWSNVDMSTGRIRITEQRLVRQNLKGKGVIDGPLKTGASERSFVLPKSLLDMLMRVGNLDGLYVCVTPTGKPWNPERLTAEWVAVRDRLGFKDWTLHDLRHCAAGTLAALGVDLLTIAAVLGHASIKTSELYAAAQEATATKGLAKVGRALARKR